MSTTVQVDDDVLMAVKERAQREKRSVGEVLSDLARQALTGSGPSDVELCADHLGFRPLPHRGPVVSNELIDRLRGEAPTS